jgi:mitochondrial fission protein ELM1
MRSGEPLRIWAVSDGRAGMANQVLGLAEAVARRVPATVTVKRIGIAAPFDRLPRAFWGDPMRRLAPDADALGPPLPDLWIACGRRTVPLSMAMRGRGPFVVQTQDPRAPADRFDLVVPPSHDGLDGPNVFPIIGSPNRLTEARLAGDAALLRPQLGPLMPPFVAVLLGGDSKSHRMDDAAIGRIGGILTTAAAAGYSLLVTPSRRTPTAALAHLRAALPPDRTMIWDGEALGALENPYFGMLGLADRVFVTAESANMLTDAAFTGRPVHLLPLTGGAPKWARLHHDLAGRGVIKPDAGYTERWDYAPLRETDRAAAEILRRLRQD